jgi:hypothetical protein
MNLKNILLDKLYGFYRYRVFPRVRHRRGTTRVLIWIEALRGKSIGKVDEEDALDPFQEEWDNLVLLDACRHDLYEEVNGETDSRISLGSNTDEYIRENFSDGDFSDVVYVTANPKFSSQIFSDLTDREPDEVFHEVFHTYSTDWDEDNSTCMPEVMLRDARTAKRFFPDKKLVIHFMQPHGPFIDWNEGCVNSEVKREELLDQWDLGRRGLVDDDVLWNHYKRDLEFVMPVVREISNFEGKTVVTSDHGNYVGEMSLYGHPENEESEILRKVPLDEV